MSITIKQAFEKLAMVTGAALKNPWFIGRNLSQTFADIADNIVDGGGSEVEVTQVLESGTKIASISVDGESTDLFAPAGASQNYSTTERVVGKWIDNSDLYEVTVSVDNPQTSTSGSSTYLEIPYSADDIDFAMLESVSIFDATDSRWYYLPFQRIQSSESINIQGMALANGSYALTIHWITAGNTYSITKVRYVLRYTKKTV